MGTVSRAFVARREKVVVGGFVAMKSWAPAAERKTNSSEQLQGEGRASEASRQSERNMMSSPCGFLVWA